MSTGHTTTALSAQKRRPPFKVRFRFGVFFCCALVCWSVPVVFAGENAPSQNVPSPQLPEAEIPKPVAPPKFYFDPEQLQNIEDRQPVRSIGQNRDEASVYNFMVSEAFRADPAELAKRARTDLSLPHLFEDAPKYRGEVIHIEGRMRLINRFEPRKAELNEGITDLYEAWIFDHRNPTRPYCVLFSHLPQGFAVGQKTDQYVAFDGFFFKIYGYQAADKARIAPLLIGHSLTLPPARSDSATPISQLLYWFVALAVVAAGSVAYLAFWFWRHDQHHRLLLARSRVKEYVETEADDVAPYPVYKKHQRISARPPRPEDENDDRLGFGKATLSPFG